MRKASGLSSRPKIRRLFNPDAQLRVAQYLLLTEVLAKYPMPSYIHAFEAGRGIPSMAAVHSGKDVVVSLDISDYFPSIKQSKVLAAFEACGLSGPAARVSSELCTYRNFLPQGGLTSPKISNIVCAMTFGPEVSTLCEEHGYNLTIYADDLTFSKSGSSTAEARGLITQIAQVLKKHGFRLNREKTKVMSRGNRQYVCGAVVNEKVNLPQQERRRLRAIVHNCMKNGLVAEAARAEESVAEFISRIRGKIGWYYQLNPVGAAPLKDGFSQCVAAYESLPAPTASQLPESNA